MPKSGALAVIVARSPSWIVWFTGFGLLSCSDSTGVTPEPEPEPPASLAAFNKIDGDGQESSAGATLIDTLVVRAIDTDGDPMADVLVAWKVTNNNGVVGSADSTTATNGEARAVWTLGTAAGENKLTVRAADTLSVTFTANGVPGPPATMEAVSGDGQEASTESPLGNPFVVRVLDAYENPVSGITVTWEAARRNDVVDPASSITDADGRAETLLTLGPRGGERTVEALAESLNAVTFTARALTAIGGIINRDRILNLKGSPYVITTTVQIAQGAILTINPGVEVRDGSIEAFGELRASGNADQRVTLTNVELSSAFQGGGGSVILEFTDMIGGELNWSSAWGFRLLTFRDSRFCGVRGGFFPWGKATFERNIFVASTGINVRGYSFMIRNNVFVRQRGYAIMMISPGRPQYPVVEYNSYLSTDRVAMRMAPEGHADETFIAVNNYWNTTDREIIESMIHDRHDDLEVGTFIDYAPFLTVPHPGTPVYVPGEWCPE